MNLNLRNPKLRKVWVFCGYCALAFPILALLYGWLLPLYQPLVIGAANLVLSWIDPMLEIEIQAHGGWEIFWLTEGSRTLVREIQGQSLHLVYLNLILLPALLISTPAAWKRRLGWIAWGMGALFLIHVGSAVGIMHADRLVQMNAGDEFWRFVSRNLKLGGQVFALLLWAALSWSYWLPQRPGTAS